MKQNVTLILSGGGARGLAHIGVIEELESRGYVINSIAGTSMGALVGGVYAIWASISIPTVFTPVISGNSVLVDGGVVNNIPIRNAIRTENDLLVASYVNADIPVVKPDLPVKEKNRRKELYAKWLNEARLHIFPGSQKDKRKKLTYFYLITNTIAFATDHLSKMIMQNDPPDILIEISRHSAGIYDYFKAEELIETGKYSAKTKLDSIN